MDKYDRLQKLQALKENGTISEEEFANEKNKILSEPPDSTKGKKILSICIALAIGIGALVGIQAVVNSSNKSSSEQANYATNQYLRNNNLSSQNTTINLNPNTLTTSELTPTPTSTPNSITPAPSSLIGSHRLVYLDGLDLSTISGYLTLKSDKTFKIFVNYTTISMELTNIEGTYEITGDKISLKITKEGGFDLGSDSRIETITVTQDNLAYSNMKFAK